MLKILIYGTLFLLLSIVMIGGHWVFISAYSKTISTYTVGTRIKAQAIEVISKPGGGSRGYKYNSIRQYKESNQYQ